VFALTDAGRDGFYAAYDDLAVQALEFLAASGGERAIEAFAASRVADMESRYADALAAAPDESSPAQVLAAALSAEGYAATASAISSGGQLCQHHCPVAHVAERFPQLCEAETEAFARLVGGHVQRLATIAHGDGICTTHIPHTQTPDRASERP
jgi:predicted ArsR family transcriptional regulator